MAHSCNRRPLEKWVCRRLQHKLSSQTERCELLSPVSGWDASARTATIHLGPPSLKNCGTTTTRPQTRRSMVLRQPGGSTPPAHEHLRARSTNPRLLRCTLRSMPQEPGALSSVEVVWRDETIDWRPQAPNWFRQNNLASILACDVVAAPAVRLQ